MHLGAPITLVVSCIPEILTQDEVILCKLHLLPFQPISTTNSLQMKSDWFYQRNPKIDWTSSTWLLVISTCQSSWRRILIGSLWHVSIILTCSSWDEVVALFGKKIARFLSLLGFLKVQVLWEFVLYVTLKTCVKMAHINLLPGDQGVRLSTVSTLKHLQFIWLFFAILMMGFFAAKPEVSSHEFDKSHMAVLCYCRTNRYTIKYFTLSTCL